MKFVQLFKENIIKELRETDPRDREVINELLDILYKINQGCDVFLINNLYYLIYNPDD